VDLTRWNEPTTPVANDYEQVVEAILLEALDDSVPAAIPSARAGGDYPTLSLPARRRLDLDAMELVIALPQQVAVRAVAKRNPDAVPLLHRPGCCDALPDISLPSWI
jgi:hypothetical protein